MAPLPDAPQRYPEGTKVYTLPIFFEVELIDPAPAVAAAPASNAGEVRS